jgi:predicted metal-dependent peptidase
MSTVAAALASAPSDAATVERCVRVARKMGWAHPFFLPLLSRSTVVADASVQTAAVTTRGKIMVCPAYIATLTDAEVAGVMAHELCHPALGHFGRAAGRPMDQWNIATDMAINAGLRAAGITLPQGALYPVAGLESASAEEIYATLAKQAQEQKKQDEQKQKAQAQDEQDDASEGQDGDDAEEGAEDDASEGQDGETGSEEGEGSEGQGSEQDGESDAEGEGTASGSGAGEGSDGEGSEGRPAPGQGCGVIVDPEESADEDARNWRAAAYEAKELARAAGDKAYGALARIVEIPPARVTWEQVLRGATAQAAGSHGRDDVTFARRSRRSPVIGAQLPGWRAQKPRVGVLIDSSGSVDEAALTRAVEETSRISKATGAAVYLVVHSAHVQFAGWLGRNTTAAEVMSHVTDRGGTRFEPAYEALRAAGHLDTVVHLTDGIPCDVWPALPPSARRLVVALVGASSRNYLPAGARVVETAL